MDDGMDSTPVIDSGRELNNCEFQSLDTWMSKITCRFKAIGVQLPSRLCCEGDREFLGRITRQYPENAAGYPGEPESGESIDLIRVSTASSKSSPTLLTNIQAGSMARNPRSVRDDHTLVADDGVTNRSHP